MDVDVFIQQLREQGFDEPVAVKREPNAALDVHTHPFEARALITAGEITLVCEGEETTYRAGDVFHLRHGQPHAERYGPQGVEYLSGRKG